METGEEMKVVTVMGSSDYAAVPNHKPQPIPRIVYTLAEEPLAVNGDPATTTEIVHTFPTQETTTVDEKTGVVTVTKTDTTLVRVTSNAVPQETPAVTLRSKKTLTEEEKQEFVKEMERQRKEIISVQRRSTPSDIAEGFLEIAVGTNAAAAMTGQVHSNLAESRSQLEGEVDSQSILDNKDNIKKFLISKMQEELEIQGEEAIEMVTTAKKTSAKSSNLKITLPSSANNTAMAPQQATYVPQVVSNARVNGTASSEEEDAMRLVAARPCYIEQIQESASATETKKEKKAASTVINENKIALEIEECRLREEELKSLRTTESLRGVEVHTSELRAVMSNGHSELEPRGEVPLLSLPVTNEIPEHMHDDRSTRRHITVRPLVEEAEEDEEKLTYMLSKESVVEREIRLTRGREEELRKEKELAVQLLQSSAAQVTASTDYHVIVDKEFVPQLPTIPDAPEDPQIPNLPNVSSLASLVIKSPDPVVVNQANQRNMASARLQQEVNETIQKELALKEAGSIATTSRDRTDDKVINLRQYKETEPVAVPKSEPVVIPQSAAVIVPKSELATVSKPVPVPRAVPQSAPVVANGFKPADAPNAFFHGRQFVFGANGRTAPSRQTSLASGTAVRMTNLHRSQTTKGVMERFIASRGKITAMPMFVRKAPKEPLTPVLLSPEFSPTPLLDAAVHQPPPLSQSLQSLQSPEMMTTATFSPNEKPAYTRRSSSVENKILEELKEMKAREEELRQQRIANFGKYHSLENVAMTEDEIDSKGYNVTSNGISDTNGMINGNGLHTEMENEGLRVGR